MSFKSPWLLLGLLVLAVAVAIWLLLDRRRARYAVRYTNLDVLATVVSGRSWLRYVPAALLVLGLASLFVGLARPQVKRTQLVERATVILVVDTSRSMQAEDVAPTRLGAAQEAIRTFIDRAPHDLRIGLVVFAARAGRDSADEDTSSSTSRDGRRPYLVFGNRHRGRAADRGRARPSGDRPRAERRRRDRSAPSSTSTRTLAQAASGPEGKSPVSILFLSDGAQTRGLLQPLEGAALPREACFPVFTIALGTPDGVIERGPFGGIPGAQDSGQLIPVPPDPETLRAIAKTTGGEFSEARTADALSRAYDNLGSRLGQEPGQSEVTWLFVAFAAVLLVFAGLLATFVSPRLP
jgi:Ca-activated chloride channel family protein